MMPLFLPLIFFALIGAFQDASASVPNCTSAFGTELSGPDRIFVLLATKLIEQRKLNSNDIARVLESPKGVNPIPIFETVEAGNYSREFDRLIPGLSNWDSVRGELKRLFESTKQGERREEAAKAETRSILAIRQIAHSPFTNPDDMIQSINTYSGGLLISNTKEGGFSILDLRNPKAPAAQYIPLSKNMMAIGLIEIGGRIVVGVQAHNTAFSPEFIDVTDPNNPAPTTLHFPGAPNVPWSKRPHFFARNGDLYMAFEQNPSGQKNGEHTYLYDITNGQTPRHMMDANVAIEHLKVNGTAHSEISGVSLAVNWLGSRRNKIEYHGKIWTVRSIQGVLRLIATDMDTNAKSHMELPITFPNVTSSNLIKSNDGLLVVLGSPKGLEVFRITGENNIQNDTVELPNSIGTQPFFLFRQKEIVYALIQDLDKKIMYLYQLFGPPQIGGK